LLTKGIYFRKFAPHTQEQNGMAERKHHHIVNMARTMLIKAQMSDTFWHDRVLSAKYIFNRLPTPLLDGLSPFHKLFSKPLDYSFLCVFGI